MNGIRSLLRFKTTYSKNDLGVLFKKMNMDTKKIFGELLETNKIRKKRLSLVDKNRNGAKHIEDFHLDRLKSKIKTTTKGKIRYPSAMGNY